MTRQFSWAKILLGIRHLESRQYDAIFWMDVDSLFLNQKIRIEDLLSMSDALIHFTMERMIFLTVDILS